MASARTWQLVKTKVAAMQRAFVMIQDAAVMKQVMIPKLIAAKKQFDKTAAGET